MHTSSRKRKRKESHAVRRKRKKSVRVSRPAAERKRVASQEEIRRRIRKLFERIISTALPSMIESKQKKGDKADTNQSGSNELSPSAKIAKELEDVLFKKHGATKDYRLRSSRLVQNLNNNKNLREMLAMKKLTVDQFVNMSNSEMANDALKKQREKMAQEKLKNSIKIKDNEGEVDTVNLYKSTEITPDLLSKLVREVIRVHYDKLSKGEVTRKTFRKLMEKQLPMFKEGSLDVHKKEINKYLSIHLSAYTKKLKSQRKKAKATHTDTSKKVSSLKSKPATPVSSTPILANKIRIISSPSIKVKKDAEQRSVNTLSESKLKSQNQGRRRPPLSKKVKSSIKKHASALDDILGSLETTYRVSEHPGSQKKFGAANKSNNGSSRTKSSSSSSITGHWSSQKSGIKLPARRRGPVLTVPKNTMTAGSRMGTPRGTWGTLSLKKPVTGMVRKKFFVQGDKAKARWSEDDQYYPCIINRVIVHGVRYEVCYYQHGNVVENREVSQIEPLI